MIKNVIFDWDNTLFPLKKFWWRAHKRIFLEQIDLKKYGLTLERLMERYAIFDEDVWNQVHRGQMTVKEAREERVRLTFDYFGIPYKEVFIRNFFDIYLTALLEEIVPEVALAERLKALKTRYRMVILSNGESLEQREKMRRFGFENLLPAYISGEQGVEKPALAAFINVLEQENFVAQETLMVGDLPENDVYPAQELQLQTAYVGPRNFTVADFTFASLDDCLDFLEQKSESQES